MGLRLSWLAFVVTIGLARLAHAEERPWAVGVPKEQQEIALVIFGQGNGLFLEGQHAAALVKYREALAAWDHPAIRYNIAVALIHLDQPVQAYEHLQAALKYGAEPLDQDRFTQAQTYKKLLLGQLAEVTVRCADADADVMLDGQALFRAPGQGHRLLQPGAHQLVASKPGYLTESRALQLPSGQHQYVTLTLTPLESLVAKRRWAPWKPWLVFGAGAVLAVVGVPLMTQAIADTRAYDAGVEKLCPGGCERTDLPSSLRAKESRAAQENGAAIAMFTLGGAVITTGIVMLVLNQPRLSEKRRPAKVSFAGTALGGSF